MTLTQTSFLDQHLARVSGNIAGAILCFYEQRLRVNPTFHMSELYSHVRDQTQTAPGSPDRVLRELKRRGQLDYRVVSRAQSRYEFLKTESL